VEFLEAGLAVTLLDESVTRARLAAIARVDAEGIRDVRLYARPQ
jgi:hypothetical protein